MFWAPRRRRSPQRVARAPHAERRFSAEGRAFCNSMPIPAERRPRRPSRSPQRVARDDADPRRDIPTYDRPSAKRNDYGLHPGAVPALVALVRLLLVRRLNTAHQRGTRRARPHRPETALRTDSPMTAHPLLIMITAYTLAQPQYSRHYCAC